MLRRSSKTVAQSGAAYVDLPSMSVIRFENLSVTNIAQSRPLTRDGKAKIKSNINV